MGHILVRIVVGMEKQKDGMRISTHDVEEARESLMKRMSKAFGGVTFHHAQGGWMQSHEVYSASEGRMVKHEQFVREAAMVFESTVALTNNVPPLDNDLPSFAAVRAIARQLAGGIAFSLNQESVLLTIHSLDTVEFIGQ